jgi:hypothetical protein
MYIISKRPPTVTVESSTVLHSVRVQFAFGSALRSAFNVLPLVQHPELRLVLHSASLRLLSPQFPSVMAFSSHLQWLHKSSRDYATHGPTIFFSVTVAASCCGNETRYLTCCNVSAYRARTLRQTLPTPDNPSHGQHR